jgi:hypothetical protein
VWLMPSNAIGVGWFPSTINLSEVVAADVDGDGHEEFLLANMENGWTGLLKWDGAALNARFFSESPLNGSAGSWIRSVYLFVAADVDGDHHVDFLIANNRNGWTGVLKWEPPA